MFSTILVKNSVLNLSKGFDYVTIFNYVRVLNIRKFRKYDMVLNMRVNNYAYNYFEMIGHTKYAHQNKKRRFMRVKRCTFYV